MPDIPECCQECVKFDKFGKSCWVYWDKKKECTQQAVSWDDIKQ